MEGGSCPTPAASSGQAPPRAGTIGDLFTSLGSGPPVLGPRFGELKAQLHREHALPPEGWERLRAAVKREVAAIRRLGSAAVPVVLAEDLERHGGRFPDEAAAQVRRRGCVVVRGTIPAAEADSYRSAAVSYVAANQERIGGFPTEAPQVWEAYWSPPQVHARQHPQMLMVQTALNRLWHCRPAADSGGQLTVDVHRPVAYCDRLRLRTAGDASFALGPHVDGGSTERWEDGEYRKAYSEILAGAWESYDAFDCTHRAHATFDICGAGLGACSIFRSFQGTLSLSSGGTGQGALLLLPMLREATAYLLLRPFFGSDVPPDSFCGANPGRVQDLYPEFHQELMDGLVPIPDIAPGDTVWWHPDLVHAVEPVHCGKEDAAAFYIPAAPLCAANARYAARQAEAFEQGRTPPDFPPNDSESGATSRATPHHLSSGGRLAMLAEVWPERPVDGESADDFAATSALRASIRDLAGGVGRASAAGSCVPASVGGSPHPLPPPTTPPQPPGASA